VSEDEMFLPLLAIFLAIAFVWAERSGRLQRLVHRQRRPRRPGREPRRALRPGSPPELVDRLKIFQEFLENLPPAEDDSEKR
jgi:hypothetical protein